MLNKLFVLNRKACTKVEPYLPQAKTDIWSLYEKKVAQYMNSGAAKIVADVGGGRSCSFAKYKDPAAGTKIIAVDVSETELQYNSDVDEKRVANIMQGLPFGPE